MSSSCELKDVQAMKPDISGVPIDRVGVKNVILPIFIVQKSGGFQHSVATFDCFISLREDKRGADMSRIPTVLYQYNSIPLSRATLEDMCKKILINNGAALCQIIAKFPYFISKKAPMSQFASLSHSDVIFDLIQHKDSNNQFQIRVITSALSMCPCSKSLSKKAAHNQRVDIEIGCVQNLNDEIIWIEDLVQVAESSASSSIYNVLKRPDEKYVVDEAYNNPKFVEDIVRAAYTDMRHRYPDIEFYVSATSHESIHQHDAYSYIRYHKT